MADSIYAQVAGTVKSTFKTRTGEAAAVEVLQKGAKYPDRVTVWGIEKLGMILEGDQVAVKGWLSWKREVKDDKTFFNVSLNEPVLVSREERKQQVVAESWATEPLPAEDAWARGEGAVY